MVQQGVEAAEWQRQYFQEVIGPLAAAHQPSEASLDRVRATNSVGVDSITGGGKGYHMAELFCLAAELGADIVSAPQITTRPPRNAAEASGQSAYEHLDLTDPATRQKLEDDLAAGSFLQVYVSFSQPDPDGPEVPTHLYATRSEAFSLEPDRTTVVEL